MAMSCHITGEKNICGAALTTCLNVAENGGIGTHKLIGGFHLLVEAAHFNKAVNQLASCFVNLFVVAALVAMA